MRTKGYPIGDNIDEVFYVLGLDDSTKTDVVDACRRLGYTDKGICYGMGRSYEKILRYKGDDRLKSVIINEVKKNSRTRAEQSTYYNMR